MESKKKNQNTGIYIAMGVVVLFILIAAGYIFSIVHKSASSSTSNASQQSSGYFGRGGGSGFSRANFASANGTVSSVGGDTIVVSTSTGNETVDVSSSTRITKTVSSTQSAVLTTNAFVRVAMDTSGDGDADTITLLPTPGGGFGGGAGGFGGGASSMVLGEVSSVSGNTLTIQSFNGTTSTLTLTASTTYQEQETGSISDITQNETITAIGQKGSNGDINARSITIGS